MNTFIIILIILTALATAFVLVRGIMIMASGKDVSGRRSNKMMNARVWLQAATIGLIVLLAFVMGAL
ncbi:twin transmembrane helix small protein [Pacificimonas flava]|uniref:Twin transmembrane helix small protein n=2 Tax=Pacificimonas TaxID=1960290 RepID=A0A219B3K5_9SPHN|nr:MULTISPECIES: twin transmembrane helix small protein [Pacificimonas]MBZ6377594.1 twin transmembrane helix small protein [Pacificimonas aurantium]OWV32716.1 twin transmembrane helix small protein [Pacificimonas flava]